MHVITRLYFKCFKNITTSCVPLRHCNMTDAFSGGYCSPRYPSRQKLGLTCKMTAWGIGSGKSRSKAEGAVCLCLNYIFLVIVVVIISNKSFELHTPEKLAWFIARRGRNLEISNDCVLAPGQRLSNKTNIASPIP